MKRSFLLPVSIGITACSTTLPATDGVKLAAAPQEITACKLLGDVRGDANLWGGMMVQVSIDDAKAQLKNKTAALGGNVVLITSSTAGLVGANMKGKAYKC